jgi:hypothetical protein
MFASSTAQQLPVQLDVLVDGEVMLERLQCSVQQQQQQQQLCVASADGQSHQPGPAYQLSGLAQHLSGACWLLAMLQRPEEAGGSWRAHLQV